MASNEMSASLNGGVAGEAAPKLTKKDLRRLGIRSIAEQAGFSFERMQAPGFTWSMLPCFEKLYPDSKKDMSEFMTYQIWSSTECNAASAWRYVFNNSPMWDTDAKTDNGDYLSVRACFAF